MCSCLNAATRQSESLLALGQSSVPKTLAVIRAIKVTTKEVRYRKSTICLYWASEAQLSWISKFNFQPPNELKMFSGTLHRTDFKIQRERHQLHFRLRRENGSKKNQMCHLRQCLDLL